MGIVEWILVSLVLALSLILMLVEFRLHQWFEPNVISMMYGFHIAAQLVPAALFLSDPTKPFAKSYFWACVLAALLIPLGGFVGNLLVPLSRLTSSSLYAVSLDQSLQVKRASRRFIFYWAIICAGIFLLYLRNVETYPLHVLLFSELTDTKALRAEGAAGTQGYVFGLALRFLMPFLFVSVLANWQFFRKGLYRLFAVSAILLAFVSNSFNTQKTPVALLFVLAFLYWLLTRQRTNSSALGPNRSGFHRWRRVVLLCLAIIGVIGYPFFIFLYLPVGQLQTFQYIIFDAILGRIFWKPAVNAYYAFEIFSGNYEFTYFSDVGKLAAVFGWTSYDLSGTIALYGYGKDFNAPSPSIGTFYAQAGWVGVVCGVLVAAMIFKACENVFLSQRKKTPMLLALYAIILYAGFRFSWGYFHTILLTEALVPTMVTLYLWRIYCQKGFRTPVYFDSLPIEHAHRE